MCKRRFLRATLIVILGVFLASCGPSEVRKGEPPTETPSPQTGSKPVSPAPTAKPATPEPTSVPPTAEAITPERTTASQPVERAPQEGVRGTTGNAARDQYQAQRSQPQPDTVSVPATQPWTDTGLDVKNGDHVRITASGVIRISNTDQVILDDPPFTTVPTQSPNGQQKCVAGNSFVAPGLHCWALIAKINDSPAQEMGTDRTFTISGLKGQTGRLYLGVNDQETAFGDNSGAWTADITVLDTATGQPGGGGQNACPPPSGIWYARIDKSLDTPMIGASAKMSQHKPWVEDPPWDDWPWDDYWAKDGNLSLAQIAILNWKGCKSTGEATGDAIELGWVVYPENYGDNNPHLFVKPTRGDQQATKDCWAADWGGRTVKDVVTPTAIDINWELVNKECGWVQESNRWYPNVKGEPSTVSADGKARQYEVKYEKGNWKVWYDKELIGYFRGSFWTEQKRSFTGFGSVRWYGEVNSDEETPCVDMGSGEEVGKPDAAVIEDMRLTDSKGNEQGADAAQNYSTIIETDPYNVGDFTGNSFAYGGPGGC